MKKNILKELVRIQNTDYFKNIPDDLKYYIHTFVRSSSLDKKIAPLQKSRAIKTSILYTKQKHPQIYHPKKTFQEWFFKTIAFFLFLNQSISFDISTPNDLLSVLISKKTEDRIVLRIYRDEINCEYIFKIRSENIWKPCYPLFAILSALYDKYGFPIFDLPGHTMRLFRSLDGDIQDFFLDYPFYMSRITNQLTEQQNGFIHCVETISPPYTDPQNIHPRQDTHGKITFQDYVELYNEEFGDED